MADTSRRGPIPAKRHRCPSALASAGKLRPAPGFHKQDAPCRYEGTENVVASRFGTTAFSSLT